MQQPGLACSPWKEELLMQRGKEGSDLNRLVCLSERVESERARRDSTRHTQLLESALLGCWCSFIFLLARLLSCLVERRRADRVCIGACLAMIDTQVATMNTSRLPDSIYVRPYLPCAPFEGSGIHIRTGSQGSIKNKKTTNMGFFS